MNESVAVIIPSLNSPLVHEVVATVLEQRQAEAITEIVVVGKDDARLLPQAEQVRLIDTDTPVLASRARNLGIQATQAELLIFLDSDCLPVFDWLEGHLAAHAAGHPVVSGSVVPYGSNYWHLIYNLTLFHELLSLSPPGPRDFLATLNLSVERHVINRVGMLDESINRVEDVDWTTRMRRAGIQPYFWPAAAVYHQHRRTTFKDVWQDCACSGYHMRQLRLRHADLLDAPGLLRYPRLIWWLSPVIASWATWRIVRKRPILLRRYWYTLPAIYLTKIGWCWGASQNKE